MKRGLALWGLMAIGGFTLPAQAELVALGGGDGGSWTERWRQSGVSGGFDMIAISIFSAGDSFVSPYVSAFSAGGWSLDFVSSDLVIFSRDDGTDVSSLDFTVTYNGTRTVEGADISTVFATFRDGALVENFDANRGSFSSGDALNLGAGWTGDFNTVWTDPASDVATALIPLPAPVAMGALGLLGVIVGRRRLRKAVA